MLAELASIDVPAERDAFARSAAGVAFRMGWGIRGLLVVGATVLAAVATVIGSRLQLEHGGAGLLAVTVPVPALLLLAVSLVAAHHERSAIRGFALGCVTLVATAAAVFVVLATEGLVWMSRLGVFALDRDPPRGPVTDLDVILDVVTTGMWVGHVVFWVLAAAAGALVGGLLGRSAPGTAAAA